MSSLFKGWKRAWLAAGGVAWVVAIAIGMKAMLDYQVRPGAPATAPATWPAESRLAAPQGEPTLLLLAHPHCPCTRATLSELERIVACTHGGIRVTVVFVVPPGLDSAWADTDLRRSAARIPGASVFIDRGGVEARRFGTATSGQALLYGADGRLAFAGGITPGRGHAGDNAGRDAVVALVSHGTVGPSTTPVFGCALATPAAPWTSGRSCPR